MPATDKFRYNLKKMHVVFAVSCAVLFLATIAMMAVDHADDWRGYQRKAFQLEAAMAARDRERLQQGDYKDRKSDLVQQAKLAEKAVRARQDELDTLEEEQKPIAFEADLLARTLKEQNAVRDKARADFDLGIRDELSQERLAELKRIFDEAKGVRDETELKLQDAEAKLDTSKAAIAQVVGERDAANEALKAIDEEINRIDKTVTAIAPTGFQAAKRWLMEQPIADGFNSHMKIVQDWLPDLSVTLGMSKIARFDRCRTCHINIDKTAAGNVQAYPPGHPTSEEIEDWVREDKFPHPFSTHPKHELYATSSSPHPVAKFGCTICHDGQGSGTSFGNAEHSPNNPHQFEEWHEEYGFHPNHFWELPMQPKRFVESGCIKCHHQVTELGVNPRFGASAPKVFKGYELIKKYGCFGCHEVHGFDGLDPIGPDLRLEPNYGSVASQMLTLLRGSEGGAVDEARTLLNAIHNDPLGSAVSRHKLRDLLAADESAETPVFSKPVSGLGAAMKDADGVAGKMRKVGPSFRRLKDKTSRGFIESWTEEPKRFRPSTRMPQFYDLSNQQDPMAAAYETVELAGIAQYLFDKSVELDMLKPEADYTPNIDRGKRLFSERGCLACHSHKEFPTSDADFGPDLSRIHEKINRNADNDKFSDWLYTWIREPERHHERTRMPNLYLESYEENSETVDPAADIAAWLLSLGGPGEFPELKVQDKALDAVVADLLAKTISNRAVTETLQGHKYPVPIDNIKGDEVELATADGSAVEDDAEWRRRKLNYVGRKTISKYGCYGCHDVPGFETARPIGAALQDWGRKDTSKLALEHIEEFLHHDKKWNGGGVSTHERVHSAVTKEASGDFTDDDERRKEMSTAYFYQSLQNHGRAGFIWQKLRQPRSYDHEKVDTKGYDERLKMPKFPFDEDDIEAIATFVLGLVAEPPSAEYVYTPSKREHDRIQGEKLLTKYNCVGCHVIDLPEITFGADGESLLSESKTLAEYVKDGLAAPGDVHQQGLDLLMKLKPPRLAFTGNPHTVTVDGETTTYDEMMVRGMLKTPPDEEEAPEDQFYGFEVWETLQLDDSHYLLPKYNMTIPVPQLKSIKPARGGKFAEWLSWRMLEGDSGIGGNGPRADEIARARQKSPPSLYLEGIKVQTQWLYEFLLEPNQLRHDTVLRMPRFNMSKEEAQTLANYFAAADGAPYPYQELTPRDPDYLASRKAELQASGLMSADEDYLKSSWNVLTGESLPVSKRLCSKCHSIAGVPNVGSGKDDIRGPDLQYASNRLRPDWLHLWIYNPGWITPYTSMPVNFTATKTNLMPEFQKDGSTQVTGARDALLNYYRLMEQTRSEVAAQEAPAEPAPGGAGDADAANADAAQN